MIFRVKAPSSLSLTGNLHLPASKSISNRALIIRAIGGLDFPIENLSESDDTQQLKHLLENPSDVINAGEGGTTLRFLMAYHALKGNHVTITASSSLVKRPLSVLVDALRSLGASVSYLNSEGSLPVRISGGVLKGNFVSVPGDVSSQFISALMMIGPCIPGGLEIEITGEVLSESYIHMTVSMMKYFGTDVKFEDNRIIIREGKYVPRDLVVEADWSAASYWYEAAALSENSELLLNGLSPDSLQGDAAIAVFMKHFGVSSQVANGGVVIARKSDAVVTDYFSADFSGCPDLGTSVAATAGALNVTSDLFGLKNFRLKESDRAVAMQRELYNFDVKTDFCGGSKFKVYHGRGIRPWMRAVNTYHDHRVAMSFAPLSLKTGVLMIDDPMVVKKSYPGFWDDLVRMGFDINEE
jgi:3-phosphoshikimate 1-carboxyvinyltransferase